MIINIGMIGLGYWGPNLVRCFNDIENCQLNYLCDKDEKKLLSFRNKYPNIKLVNDAEKIFQDKSIHAVVIATPSNTHVSLVKKALLYKKHVFVEKPFTLKSIDAKKLVNLSYQKKKYIFVGHTYEYHPAILKIKEFIDEGLLGDIYYIYESRLNLGKVREETNVLWNLAPHDVSIANFLLNKKPIAVQGFGQSYLRDGHEDVVFINIRYPNSVITHVHVSWLDPSKERKLTIIGSKKMVIFNDLDNEASVKIYDKGFIKLVDNKGERIYKEFSLKLRPGDIHIPYIESKEPLKEECKAFINSIVNNTKPKTDGQNGLEVVKVLEAVQKSLNSNSKWIKII